MASSVEKYNQLDGQVVEREQLENILTEAKTDEQYFIVQKLESLLATWPEAERFHIKLENLLQEQFPASLLGCIDECPFTEDDAVGLAGAVKPDDIYQMITDKLLAQYKEASGSGYKKKWKKQNIEGYLIPFNWESKKPYRGINIMLLTDGMSEVMKNPFFLTFKQIEANKAKLKKGSKGLPVVYFTRLYLVEETGKDGKKINFGTYDQKKFNKFIDKNASKLKREADFYKNKYIPIIKYYNVFNGADVEGIDFDLANFKTGYQSAAEITKNDDPRIKLADAIVENYPKPKPKLIHHKKDEAFYRSNITGSLDEIRMPGIEDFETSSDYYRTLLHEFSHSTGVKNRLDREEFHKYDTAKKYRAKEELVAEMGAVFLSAHAGIIWHNNKNHAEYLKNWGRALEHIEKDNRFLMRAASAAQASTDFVLNYDAQGVPAYMSKINKKQSEKEQNFIGYMLVDDILGVTIASKKTLAELKEVYLKTEKTKGFEDIKPLVYEIIKQGNKNVAGKEIEVDWDKKEKENQELNSKVEPKTNELKVVATSPKGAMLITDGNKVAWIMKRSRRKDGTFTPGAYSAIAESDVSLDDYEAKGKTTNKTKYHLFKYDYIVRETPKAVLVRSFNGSEDWLPKTAIIEDYGGTKSDRMWVASWALKNKNVQYSKKTQYFERGLSAPSKPCSTAGKKLAKTGSSKAGKKLATTCKTETAKIRTAKKKGNHKEVCSTSGRALAKEGTSEAGKTLAACDDPFKKNGRLKKGFRYVKGGKIVKAGDKKEGKKENPPQIHRKSTKKRQKSTANPPLQKKKEASKSKVDNLVSILKSKYNKGQSLKSLYNEAKEGPELEVFHSFAKSMKNNKKFMEEFNKSSFLKNTNSPKANNTVKTLPIGKINTDVKRFQNRKKLNQTIVSNIVDNFNETNLDPLIIWLDSKDNKYYLLAGHHRLEALKQLKYKNVPVKVANKDYPTEADAIRFAKEESNANRSLEKPYERAAIYRKYRLDGKTAKEIDQKARIEGKNRSFILNLSYLNPKGKLMQNIIQFDNSTSVQDTREIEKIADWVGQARRNYDMLTDAHETEMYNFLKDKNLSKRTPNKVSFIQKITSTVSRFDFEADQPLNIARFKYESEGEKVYNREYTELKSQIEDYQDKISEIKARFSDPKNKDYIDPEKEWYTQAKKVADSKIAEYNDSIRFLQSKILSLVRNKSDFTNAGSNQAALFGVKKRKGLKGVSNFKVEEIETPQPETNANQNISAPSPSSTRKPINKSKKVNAIDYIEQRAPEFKLGGAAGEFLGKLERKPVHSIIVTVDASAGAGKTTTLFKWLNDFAKAGHQGVFLSLEEHPQSNLFQDKVNEHLEDHTRQNVDTVDEVEDYEDFKNIIQPYDYVFIDSFQKLRELVGNIKIDKDIRKAFNGKVFVIVFQRTKDGKMRGGSDCEFDGDIIIKGTTGESFEENYFIASKNRYTNQDISKVAYNVASNKVFDPTKQSQKSEKFKIELF